jgi:hypothetical protein
VIHPRTCGQSEGRANESDEMKGQVNSPCE